MASGSFQNEVPKARINIKLDLHTGDAQKKTELPLKLMVMGDYSNGREQRPLFERKKVAIDKNNFDSVLAEYSPEIKLAVANTLVEDASEASVDLSFQSMKDFEPEQVARQIPQLRALLAPLLASPKAVGLELTIYDPDLDPDGRYGAALAHTIEGAFADSGRFGVPAPAETPRTRR